MSLLGIALLGVVVFVAWQYFRGDPAIDDENRDRDQQDDVLQAIESMQGKRPRGELPDEDSAADT